MSITGPNQEEAITRRDRLENPGRGRSVEDLERRIRDLERLTRPIETTPPVDSGIQNMIRNGDHAHNLETWYPTSTHTIADNEHECANVYAYEGPIDPIKITDAQITSGSAVLTSVAALFTSAMVGRRVVVEGAGASGADLLAVIQTFTSTSNVTLDTNAGTTVTGATAFINLILLGHKNTITDSVATVNDTLKSDSHSNFATNIQDPKWDTAQGYAELGSTNLLAYPLGFYALDATTYVALNGLFPGRELYVQFIMARANQYVKIAGRLFCGLYNNSSGILDWVKGDAFSLSGAVVGSPGATTSTEYVVVLETDQGFNLVSQVLTVANAPDDAGFSSGARVSLAWEYYAGVTNVIIYRKRSGGNVFKLEENPSASNTYTDVNNPLRIDTGSTSFPAITNEENFVRSYFAFSDDLTPQISYDGEPDRTWSPMTCVLPFPASIQMANVFDPHLVIGLTTAVATEVTDVVVPSSGKVVTSASAQFTAAMAGKAVKLTNANGDVFETSVDTFNSATEVALDALPSWSGSDIIMEIADSQPHGLLFDKIGVALNPGAWNPHIEDYSENRNLPSPILPTGGNQGGNNPVIIRPEGGSGGPVRTPIELPTDS